MKKSPEELFLEAQEKEARKIARTEAAALKKIPKEKKPEPSEKDLVHRYANRVIKNQIYHGRIDSEKFQGLAQERSVSKNLWMDADFFFSVVFQSQAQKMDFLAQLKCGFDPKEQAQIVNGLELAKTLGITLKLETTKDYPVGDPNLLPLVLDNEEF